MGTVIRKYDEPYDLPPGADRRALLLERGLIVQLTDFTREELAGLQADLAAVRATLRTRPDSA